MSFTNMPACDFVSALASKEPTPGGGGASALAGALGAALGRMAGNLTAGKKKYAGAEDEIRRLMERLSELQDSLLGFTDADAESFEPLAKAYKLKKGDPSRETVMEAALKVACAVPLDIMRACAEALEIMDELIRMISSLAVPDAAAGAKLLEAALAGAGCNIYANAKYMKDREYASAVTSETDGLIKGGAAKADGIGRYALDRLRG